MRAAAGLPTVHSPGVAAARESRLRTLAGLTESVLALPMIVESALPFIITEAGVTRVGGEDLMKVRGVVQRANEVNSNGRIYPRSLLAREVARLTIEIENGRSLFREADHPEDGQSRIVDTAALWKSLRLAEDNSVIGEALILRTPMGQVLEGILRAGGRPGVSARGFGTSVRGEYAGVKGDIVQDDYRLCTFDFVVVPSTRCAYVEAP